MQVAVEEGRLAFSRDPRISPPAGGHGAGPTASVNLPTADYGEHGRPGSRGGTTSNGQKRLLVASLLRSMGGRQRTSLFMTTEEEAKKLGIEASSEAEGKKEKK
jgi:hypothetical protein